MEVDVSVGCSECGANLTQESGVDTSREGIEVSAALCEKCLEDAKNEAAQEREDDLREGEITDLNKEIEDLKEQLKLAIEKNLKSVEDIKTAQDLLKV
jgi:hypothetical protein